MRLNKILAIASFAMLFIIAVRGEPRSFRGFDHSARKAKIVDVAVGSQYDTTHVCVSPQDFDRFVASLIATFGGTATKRGVSTITPMPSRTISQLVLTPVGTVSVLGFETPVPYPLGADPSL